MRKMGKKLAGIKRYPKEKKAGEGSLIVCEIYSALDGEGPWQGYPVTIVRLMGCNLRCSYCDTAFAYSEGQKETVGNALKKVSGLRIRKVLVTGGEPLAQGGARFFIRELLRLGFEVSIETNGSYSLKGIPEKVVKIVDVKTPGSGEGGSFLEGNLDLLDEKDCLKFVVTSKDDYEWARGFLSPRRKIRCEAVFAPAFGMVEPRALAAWMLRDNCPARFSLQLHKVVWGEQRGV